MSIFERKEPLGMPHELDSFANALEDPMLRGFKNTAREVWRDVYSPDLAGEDIQELIHELDNECWGIFLEQEMSLTGHIQEVTLTDNGVVCERSDATGEIFVEDWRCYSLGFMAVDRGDGSCELGLLCGSPMKAEDGSMHSGLYLYSWDSLTYFDNVASTEHTHATLDSLIPRTMSEVDEAIFDIDSDPARAVMALKAIDFSELESLWGVSANTYTRTASMLGQYIERSTNVDMGMPHIVSYSGPVIVGNQTQVADLEETEFAVHVHGVTIITVGDDQGMPRAALGLSSIIHREASNEDEGVVLLVDCIEDFTSFRDYLYG